MKPILLALLACPMLVLDAAAQSAAPFVAAEGLPTVWVSVADGAEYRGKLLRVDADELVLLTATEERRFTRASILQIHKRGDSLKNGAIIGAVIGTALGLLAAGIADCPGLHQDRCTGTRIGVALTSIGIYTAVGTGIDAAVQGRTLIYAAPSAGTGTPRRAGAGVRFSLRW
ncbi:MAG TPA: hypothetical protein VM364_23325 [Vicinamibacterales bacterium]|nr:hypothetical protein [Vicinamibacterales bacterium]